MSSADSLIDFWTTKDVVAIVTNPNLTWFSDIANYFAPKKTLDEFTGYAKKKFLRELRRYF